MIKLLALDLDDTLLKEDLSISSRNKTAIKEAEALGVIVLLASGRAFPAMERFAEELGLLEKPGYLISDNGSTVYSTKPFKTLVLHQFNGPIIQEIFSFFEDEGLPVQVYKNKTILVTKENRFTSKDMELSGYSRIVDPALAHSLDFLPQKFVIPGEPEILPEVLKKLNLRFSGQVNAFISKPYFLEVLPPLADKGTSLQFVSQSLNIDPSEVMAMGDAANDIGMIQFAGKGIAMANAVLSVKQVAKHITTLSHEDDGVAEMIEKFILQPQ